MKTPQWSPWGTAQPPALLARSLTPMQQHPLYGAGCAAIGGSVAAFALNARGRHAQGWAQVLERRWPGIGRVAMLARGPIWDEGVCSADRYRALDALLQMLSRCYNAVMATPDPIDGVDPLAQRGWLALVAGGSVARLPLVPDEAALRGGLHGKWRNRLVRAEGAGLDVSLRPFDPHRDHWLLQREATQSRQRGYKRLPESFTLGWRTAGGGRAALLATAQRGAEVLAGMVFLRHGAMASYHVGWTSAEGRACDAHRLLLYRSALHLAEKGHSALELGTLDTVTTPGLARFKLGCGAHQVPLSATRIKAPGSALVARLIGDHPRAA